MCFLTFQSQPAIGTHHAAELFSKNPLDLGISHKRLSSTTFVVVKVWWSQLRSSWHQQGWLYESMLLTRTVSHARCAIETAQKCFSGYGRNRNDTESHLLTHGRNRNRNRKWVAVGLISLNNCNKLRIHPPAHRRGWGLLWRIDTNFRR